MDLIDEPETVQKAAELIGGLLSEFLQIQRELIGEALVKPGHGFASSRCFAGVGESTDNVIMFSAEQYNEVFVTIHERLGRETGDGYEYPEPTDGGWGVLASDRSDM